MKDLTNKIADLIYENEGWKHRYTDAYNLANKKILELPELKAIQVQAKVIFTSEQVLKLLEKQRANCYEAFVNIKPLRRDTRFETYRKQIEAIKNAPLANLSE